MNDPHFAALLLRRPHHSLRAAPQRTRGVRVDGRHRTLPGLPRRRGSRPARGVGRDGAIGFRGRPVAALANETRFHAGVRPGDIPRARGRHRAMRRRSRGLRRQRARRRQARHRTRRLPGADAARRGLRRPRGARRAADVAARAGAVPGRLAASPRRRSNRSPASPARPGCRVPPEAPFFNDLSAPPGVSGDADARRAIGLRAASRRGSTHRRSSVHVKVRCS